MRFCPTAHLNEQTNYKRKTIRIVNCVEKKLHMHVISARFYDIFFCFSRTRSILASLAIDSHLIEACLSVDLSNRMYQSGSNRSFTIAKANISHNIRIGHVNVTSIKGKVSLVFIILPFDYVFDISMFATKYTTSIYRM